MNKRDRQQLKASIARDLIQGQGEHTATREPLKQYAPLEGVLTTPAGGKSSRPSPTPPVEKTLEHHATVKGELRVPNTINFSLFPTLDPFAKAVYYQLYLLSHGFRRDTCVVGLAKLAKSVLMSQRKVQDTILYLERRGLIRRLRAILGGPSKGNVYQVPIPAADAAPGSMVANDPTVAESATMAHRATIASEACVAPHATNKDDDDYKKQSSSNGGRPSFGGATRSENHSGAAAPRERYETPDGDCARVRTAYENATGNVWNKSDSAAFQENGLDRIPVDKIISVLETVTRRTPTKINSFRYYLKEILAVPNRRSRAWRKKQLEKIVLRIRDNSVGRAAYSSIDFLEDVKCACAREAVPFDDDLFNELAG